MKHFVFMLLLLLSVTCFAQYDSCYLLEISKGNITNHFSINAYGNNPAVATGPEDVWSGGGLYAFYPATAQQLEVVSDDANDTAAGTGARTVYITGLDANWDIQTETVTLDGVTDVNTANLYIRINDSVVMTAGSGKVNDGNITIRIDGGGTTADYIPAELSGSQRTIYSTPRFYSGYFIKGYVGISDGGNAASRESAEFKWKYRRNDIADGAWITEGNIECINDGNNWWQYSYGIPVGPLPPKTDVRIECSVTSAALGVVGGYDMILAR